MDGGGGENWMEEGVRTGAMGGRGCCCWLLGRGVLPLVARWPGRCPSAAKASRSAHGGRSLLSLPLPAVAALCEALGALSSMCPAHGREGLTPLVDLLVLSS